MKEVIVERLRRIGYSKPEAEGIYAMYKDDLRDLIDYVEAKEQMLDEMGCD